MQRRRLFRLLFPSYVLMSGAIVKHITLAHDGNVCAESEVDRGSTFCMCLPTEETAPVVPGD
jgi:light-regulated signal transduction histidine kinase (bacteriophytochrome)